MSEERARGISADIQSIAESVERRFQTGRRVLSFAEYLALMESAPVRYTRDASRYLRDVFEHYGSRKVDHPWGEFTRWNLFDMPWDADLAAKASGPRDSLTRGAEPGGGR